MKLQNNCPIVYIDTLDVYTWYRILYYGIKTTLLAYPPACLSVHTPTIHLRTYLPQIPSHRTHRHYYAIGFL